MTCEADGASDTTMRYDSLHPRHGGRNGRLGFQESGQATLRSLLDQSILANPGRKAVQQEHAMKHHETIA